MTLLEPTRDKPFRVFLRVRTARVTACMAAVYVTVAGSVWAHGISVDGSADFVAQTPDPGEPNLPAAVPTITGAGLILLACELAAAAAAVVMRARSRAAIGTREVLGSHASTRLDGAGTHGPVQRSAHDQRAV
jgi:hypothetical protein